MGSDRARRSYDASRMYQSVVAQQGRVTLEADANEAEEIRGAESRDTLIDLIGPSGSPDAGFRISVPGGTDPLDFAVGAGTLYVGGQRVACADPNATYLRQKLTEWVDYPAGRPADEPPEVMPLTEAVYLLVSEQEVSAVEDEALREVALGGPDTAARTRLIRRVHRVPVAAAGCDEAFAQVLKEFHARDASFDPKTMRLESTLGLRVDFAPDPAPADACQPTAQTGFLGPENQLIRVQVTAEGKLLWGWDNASFLYRATIPSATSVRLEGIPVDVYHQPRAGQRVEILGKAVDLGGGAFVASQTGTTAAVNGYDPGERLVTLANGLPAALVQDRPLQVFVRVWEAQFDFAPDETTATQLVDASGTGTGVLVFTKGAGRAPGDFWTIGVRPGTPHAILPARLADFQPPDGPKRWAVPLAVIAWHDLRSASVSDCRLPFDSLVCEDDDLEFHNQHLHGWGVVCGLQVQCAPPAYADAKKLKNPGEWVLVRDGYAIDPSGRDIRLHALDDGFTAVPLGNLAAASRALARDTTTGKLSDGSVSLWIDKQRKFHAEKYAASPSLLEGTLLADIYQDCLLPLIEFVSAQVTPTSSSVLVSPQQKLTTALLNLSWQLASPASGAHIFLSGDPAGRDAGTEDAVLRAFFSGLKKILQDRTFCALFDDVAYPAYDVYRDGLPAAAPRPTTIFSNVVHTRIRVHPRRPLAFTCGSGSKVNVFDLTGKGLVASVDFPEAGAEVQDVAFPPDDEKVMYVIAWTGGGTQSMFAVANVAGDGRIVWTGDRIPCPNLKLVTLATTARSKRVVYAAARGEGIFLLKAGANAPVRLGQRFLASGHLVATAQGDAAFLYAGLNDSEANSVQFHRIVSLDVSGADAPANAPTAYYALPPNGSQQGIGHDEIAIFPGKDGRSALYAIVDGAGDSKRLVRWIAGSGQPAPPGRDREIEIDLGPGSASSIAYSSAGKWAMITFADGYAGRPYRPDDDVVDDILHPLQIGTSSVAASADGAWFYALNPLSQTITAVPARDETATPWQSAVQMAKLAAYRKVAIAAFLGAADRLLQYLKDRACGQLLVECPTVKDRKVYLADVSFQGGKVYQICNFHHRKYVHTFPTVEYWMSIVPILPVLKTLVETVCCSVIAGSAGKLAAALTAAAKGDLFPATALRNAIVRLKAANPVEQMQKYGSRGEMVGRYAKAQLERTLRLPGPGAPAGQTSATDVIDHPAAAAAQIAAAKGIQVRHAEIASGTPSALLSMFTAPSVGTGDTVDLITDAGGRVIAWKKVSAEGAAQPSDEVVALRRDLARMTVAHDQQAAAVTEMQHKLEEMAAAIAALHR